jgi:hypothetical protein
MFFSLPTIGSLSFSPSTLFASHPIIMYEVIGHAIGHTLFGFIKRNRKRRGLSRSQMRKIANRRRRQFVDNIIMHHQRLANINRQLIVNNARERAVARREKIKSKSQNREASRGFSFNRDRSVDPRQKWRQNEDLKERGKRLRGMSDARRVRARSKWLTVMSQNG